MAKKNYYGFQKSKLAENRDMHYVPQGLGKVVMMIAAPSAIVSMLSVIALFFLRGNAQGIAMMIALGTFAISFLGSIFMMIDVIRFHGKKTKKNNEKAVQQGPDIMRIIHMLIGMVVGIIIGYLIWGGK